MALRKITEKPKKRWGLFLFMVILLLLGFAVSAFLVGKGLLDEIIHP